RRPPVRDRGYAAAPTACLRAGSGGSENQFAISRSRRSAKRALARMDRGAELLGGGSMTRRAFFSLVGTACILLCSSCGSDSRAPAQDSNAQNTQVPSIDVVKVASRKLSITVRLPGELQPYEVVSVYPKVAAFVGSISVDRGSAVKTGQVMARLVAPELAAQRAEAQS